MTTPERLPEDGPTQLVEAADGRMVERLSGSTATLLLVWLIGIGAGSALLAAWGVAAALLDVRLSARDLLGETGFYLGLLGASGPCVLWLTGRAQGHSLGWFILAALRIGLVMAAILIGGGALVLVVMGGGIGSGFAAVAVAVGLTVLAAGLSVIWALAVWSADRWIARARLAGESGPPS
ncbi:MAG TPA: hypothetical protein VJA85_01580 [Candidatus Limnocylindria bacterium]|nr:hypothetical protein [Candidatus Limnocylindria bacterium]